MVAIKKVIITATYLPMVWLIHYLGLNAESVAILSTLLVVDTITGFWKEKAIGGVPTSTRLANGIISKMVLLIVPFLVALAAKGVGVDISTFVVVVIDILIISELYSTIANIYTIRSKKQVEEFDALSFILKRIRSILDRMLGDEPKH